MSMVPGTTISDDESQQKSDHDDDSTENGDVRSDSSEVFDPNPDSKTPYWGGEGFPKEPNSVNPVSEFHKLLLGEVDNGRVLKTEDDLKLCVDNMKQKPIYLLSNGRSNRTILHLAIETSEETFESRKSFVKLLLKLDHKLPLRKTITGETAMFIAVNNEAIKMVKFLCEESAEAITSLGIYGPNKTNCLHVAIEKPIKDVGYLVSQMESHIFYTEDVSQSSTLKETDLVIEEHSSAGRQRTRKKTDIFVVQEGGNGNTPLHIAVHYKHCIKSQDALVELLVRCSASALEIKNNKGLEPLRYHQKTRERRMARQRQKNQKDKEDLFKDGSQNRSKPNNTYLDGSNNQVTRSHSPNKPQICDEAANNIELNLKLHCLRTKNRRDARELLYGNGEKLEIEFHLGRRKQITKLNLENMQKHIKFDSAIQYVRIPVLKVEKNSDFEPSKKAQSLGVGRKDYCVIFDWLKKQGVKRILRIIVDDYDPDVIPASHSDEAIEAALSHSKDGIEVWKWKKLDISLEVIGRCAPNVEDLHLYWSGNNVVLWAWSDRGLLEKLKKLRLINVHTEPGLETPKRLNEDVGRFKERIGLICQSWRERRVIEVMVQPLSSSSTRVNRNQTELYDNTQMEGGVQGGQRWLTCMEKFATFVRNCQDYSSDGVAKVTTQQSIDSATQEDFNPDVKVALIDDGVDPFHDNLSLTIAIGESWCEQVDSDGLQPSYHQSSNGHGTAMAFLIRRICPWVLLYVAKLDEKQTEQSANSFTAASAVKAVRWAIENEVHIISMSWTIEKTQANARDIEDLETALSDASRRKILLFCSMSDEKISPKDKTYPVNFPLKKFKIGAASETGSQWEQRGDKHNADYSLPGTNFIFESEQSPLVVPRSGSSIATALAAGLAAIILHCALCRKESDFELLRSHEQMDNAFKAIGTTDDKYILVWNVFETYLKNQPHGEHGGTLNEIMEKLLSRSREV